MKRLRFGGALALLALFASSGAALAKDEPPLVMEPASAWTLVRAEDSCAVRRAFQAGEDTILAELRQFAPGDDFQVTLVSETLARTGREPKVRFDPDAIFEPASAFYFRQGAAEGVLYSDSLLPNVDTNDLPSSENGDLENGGLNLDTLQADLAARVSSTREWTDSEREARELAITGLTVKGAFERDLVLQTGRMLLPMADLRDCMDVLLERWGMDADIQHTLSRPPLPIDQEKWTKRLQQNYPMRQLMNNQSGFAILRLIVDAEGKPRECIVNKDSPDHGFDEAACDDLMRYGRYQPALDADGAPTEGLVMYKVIYQIVG